ncbi:MAG TPA: endolytic transglycosylase MltG [Wenzhouxiangella sp.]
MTEKPLDHHCLGAHRLMRWSAAALLVVAGFFFVVGKAYVERMEAMPLSPVDTQPSVIQIRPGMHFKSLMSELQWLGVTRPSWWWRVYGRLHQPFIKAGEYQLSPGDSLADFLAKLQRGDVVLHPLTIVEGWTVAQLREALTKDPRLESVTADWSEAELMEELGCLGCDAEGQFLPETYFFQRGESDLDVLKRSHQALQQALSEVWETRDEGLPLDNANELLILASLIERETGLASERGTIAGVFVRRLNLGMRLQTDPTVIYGLGPTYNGRLTRQDLRTDHPWNTYMRHGLPVTPIALPSLASLRAASQPEAGEVLYFVARGDGSHVFSVTLEQHNAAVNRYIRGRKP